MKKIIYNVFFIAGLVTSAFSFSKQVANATDLAVSNESKSPSESDQIYFSDILEQQTQQSGLVAAHYSHRSHSSHYSHRSHYSGY